MMMGELMSVHALVTVTAKKDLQPIVQCPHEHVLEMQPCMNSRSTLSITKCNKYDITSNDHNFAWTYSILIHSFQQDFTCV